MSLFITLYLGILQWEFGNLMRACFGETIWKMLQRSAYEFHYEYLEISPCPFYLESILSIPLKLIKLNNSVYSIYFSEALWFIILYSFYQPAFECKKCPVVIEIWDLEYLSLIVRIWHIHWIRWSAYLRKAIPLWMFFFSSLMICTAYRHSTKWGNNLSNVKLQGWDI